MEPVDDAAQAVEVQCSASKDSEEFVMGFCEIDAVPSVPRITLEHQQREDQRQLAEEQEALAVLGDRAPAVQRKLDFLRGVYRPYACVRAFYEDAEASQRRQRAAMQSAEVPSEQELAADALEHEANVVQGRTFEMPSAAEFQAAAAKEIRQDLVELVRTKGLTELEQALADTGVDAQAVAEADALAPALHHDNVWVELLESRIYQFDMKTTQFLPMPLESDMAQEMMSQVEFGPRIAQQIQCICLMYAPMLRPPFSLVLTHLPMARHIAEAVISSFELYSAYERYIMFFGAIKPNDDQDVRTAEFVQQRNGYMAHYGRVVKLIATRMLSQRDECDGDMAKFRQMMWYYTVALIHAQESLLMSICRIGLFDTVTNRANEWHAPGQPVPIEFWSEALLREANDTLYSNAAFYTVWNHQIAHKDTPLPEGTLPPPHTESLADLDRRYIAALYEYTGTEQFRHTFDSLAAPAQAPAAQ